MAFGQIGMAYEEFLNITPRQFFNAVEGFISNEQRKEKDAWKRTSVILAYITNKPVYGYKVKTSTPQQLLPFAWDADSELPDEEDLERLRKETWPQQ